MCTVDRLAPRHGDGEIQRAVVVSDLHIGDRFFHRAAFIKLIESLGKETALILNGDIIDNPYQRLPAQDEGVLDLLREQSWQRQVIWIYGNHDAGFHMPDPGRIEFRRQLAVGTRLMVIHGDDFDTVMPNNRWFIRLFKFCHNLRLRAGAAPVHVAELAKRWLPLLYRVLTEQVKSHAIDCAVRDGFTTITCGHTHYAEDVISRGVRYVNTGAWTEEPVHYLLLNGAAIHLRTWRYDAYAGQLGLPQGHAELDQTDGKALSRV